MSITFSLSVGAQHDVRPAVVTARQLAAFRSFARERGELLDIDDEDALVACSFEARVCPWSLASVCALFDYDEAVIAVVEEAQFRSLNIRFQRDATTRSITMGVASSPDGSSPVSLLDQNARRVLKALHLRDDNRGSLPLAELRDMLKDPSVRHDLHDLDTGDALGRFDILAGHAGDDHELRVVWG